MIGSMMYDYSVSRTSPSHCKCTPDRHHFLRGLHRLYTLLKVHNRESLSFTVYHGVSLPLQVPCWLSAFLLRLFTTLRLRSLHTSFEPGGILVCIPEYRKILWFESILTEGLQIPEHGFFGLVSMFQASSRYLTWRGWGCFASTWWRLLGAIIDTTTISIIITILCPWGPHRP